MKLFDDVYTVPGHRAVYFKALDLVAISDLQLGEERYYAVEAKVFVPEVQLQVILKELEAVKEKTGAGRLLIDGDFKHEFGEASRQEWKEVEAVYNKAKNLFREVIVVRGNHDNYLLTIAGKLGFSVNERYYESGYLFVHGHRLEDLSGVSTLVIGHEQPAVLLRRSFDRVKLPVILYGETRSKRRFVCLPAFSPIASGVEVNAVPKGELLSPFFANEVDVDELYAVAEDPDVGELFLSKVKHLREFISTNT